MKENLRDLTLSIFERSDFANFEQNYILFSNRSEFGQKLIDTITRMLVWHLRAYCVIGLRHTHPYARSATSEPTVGRYSHIGKRPNHFCFFMKAFLGASLEFTTSAVSKLLNYCPESYVCTCINILPRCGP